jgi:nicotinate-nucleotide adenylyltransferase
VKIGILGGTFDPVHNGHIKVAEEVRAQLDLTKVVFLPASQPWLKADSPISPAEHRVEMVRLAIATHPEFELSLVEINRPGPSYTVDTIEELRVKLNTGDEVFFILGWDSLLQLPRWKEPTRLIRLCRLVTVPRPGYKLPDLKQLEALIPGLSPRLIVLDRPEIDVCATQIRKRVAQGLSIRNLVPSPVADYIKQHKLYIV